MKKINIKKIITKIIFVILLLVVLSSTVYNSTIKASVFLYYDFSNNGRRLVYMNLSASKSKRFGELYNQLKKTKLKYIYTPNAIYDSSEFIGWIDGKFVDIGISSFNGTGDDYNNYLCDLFDPFFDYYRQISGYDYDSLIGEVVNRDGYAITNWCDLKIAYLIIDGDVRLKDIVNPEDDVIDTSKTVNELNSEAYNGIFEVQGKNYTYKFKRIEAAKKYYILKSDIFSKTKSLDYICDTLKQRVQVES